jgi:hypothetical protein
MLKALLRVTLWFCLFHVTNGGLYKKLFKGLAFNAAEKAYIEKIKKVGVQKVIMGSDKPTRQEIVTKRDEKVTSKTDRRLMQRTSERAKISISRRLAQITGKSDELRPKRRAIGGGRPGALPTLEQPRRRRQEKPADSDGDGDGDGDTAMLPPARAAPAAGGADGGDAASRRPGWQFDEAIRRKAAGERAFLRRSKDAKSAPQLPAA